MNATLGTVIASNALPLSFHGDRFMFGANLAGLTTLTYMGGGAIYWLASAIWCNRKWDRWTHTATLFRIAWLCAAVSLTLRSGSEAAYLWAWDPRDPSAGAMVLRVKWYVTGLSFGFAFAWLALLVLTYATVIEQLRRQPLPVKVWAKAGALVRPAIVAVLSTAMSIGVVWLRG
jgi:hypothetical protein